MRTGLSRTDVERLLRKRLESDPDLKYYIEDEYITKIIELLIEGMADVILENNRRLFDDFRR